MAGAEGFEPSARGFGAAKEACRVALYLVKAKVIVYCAIIIMSNFV